MGRFWAKFLVSPEGGSGAHRLAGACPLLVTTGYEDAPQLHTEFVPVGQNSQAGQGQRKARRTGHVKGMGSNARDEEHAVGRGGSPCREQPRGLAQGHLRGSLTKAVVPGHWPRWYRDGSRHVGRGGNDVSTTWSQGRRRISRERRFGRRINGRGHRDGNGVATTSRRGGPGRRRRGTREQGRWDGNRDDQQTNGRTTTKVTQDREGNMTWTGTAPAGPEGTSRKPRRERAEVTKGRGPQKSVPGLAQVTHDPATDWPRRAALAGC